MNLGVSVTVTGVLVPYTFTDEDTGEQRGYLQLRVPGDIVSLDVSPELSEKMKVGETWTVKGTAIIRKKKATLHIDQVESLTRISKAAGAEGPKVDFGDLDEKPKYTPSSAAATK